MAMIEAHMTLLLKTLKINNKLVIDPPLTAHILSQVLHKLEEKFDLLLTSNSPWYQNSKMNQTTPLFTTSTTSPFIPTSPITYSRSSHKYVALHTVNAWRQVPAQHVHFSTRALIWFHHKAVNPLSQLIFLNFHTETALNTIQSLYCVVVQIF